MPWNFRRPVAGFEKCVKLLPSSSAIEPRRWRLPRFRVSELERLDSIVFMSLTLSKAGRTGESYHRDLKFFGIGGGRSETPTILISSVYAVDRRPDRDGAGTDTNRSLASRVSFDQSCPGGHRSRDWESAWNSRRDGARIGATAES